MYNNDSLIFSQYYTYNLHFPSHYLYLLSYEHISGNNDFQNKLVLVTVISHKELILYKGSVNYTLHRRAVYLAWLLLALESKMA